MSYTLHLQVFEGPLHLLLHLIRTHKLEITDIPIASVTEQYIEYLSLMEEMNLDVAGEFLVMAATLMEIKSRMLLPRPPRENPEEEGPDPREELVQRLLEYERYQRVAEELRALEKESLRSFSRNVAEEPLAPPLKELTPADLLTALQRMLAEQAPGNGKGAPTLRVRREAINLRARIAEIWDRVTAAAEPVRFTSLLPPERRSRPQIIATFLAILELMRQERLVAWQEGPRGEICLAARPGADPAPPSEA
jgi:segregation and condensation protein A